MLQKLRDDFRLGMAILLSGCAVLAIGPFAIIRALKGDWVMAGLDTVITIGVASIFRYHLVHGRSDLSSTICAGFYSLAGLGMSYVNPQPMIYWIYPIILANFFLLNLRAAIIINAALFFCLMPLAPNFTAPLEFFDLMVSIALVAAFAGIFAWKTEDQRQLLDDWAHMDALTGVGNRRKFFSVLKKQNATSPSAVILMDLDHFKAINDQNGHEAGDNMLQSVAALIKKRLRAEGDDVFRYGGEEFLLLLNNTDIAGACRLAESIRSSLESTLGITASFGCAQHKENETWDSWIARADKELYSAKNAGRNGVRPALGTTSSEHESADAPQ